MSVFARLLRYARPYVWLVALGLLCGVANSGARNLRAYLLKPVMDEVAVPAQSLHESGPFSAWKLFGGGDDERAPSELRVEPDAAEEAAEKQRLATSIQKSLRRIAAVMLVVILLLPLSEFGKSYVVEYVLGRVLVDLQHTLCAKLLSLPLRFHHGTTRGDTLSRLLNDAGRAHRALDLLFADVIQAVFGLLIGACVLLYISWQLTLVALCIAPPLVAVISIFGRRIRKTARRRQERTSDVTARLVQILGGIKLIKAFRAEAHEEARFTQDNQRLFRASMRVVRNRVTSKSLIEFLNNAMATVMPLLGVWLVIRGQWGITVGDLVAFLTVLATTYAPVKDLAKGWTELMDATPAAERFFEVIDAPGEAADAPDAVRIDGVREGVRFDRVGFSYGREPVLEDVSLDVRAGEVVAIVGRTGAGKTTLVDLLLRFYEPDAGAISIDGVDLRRIARESLLDHVAVVSQEPFLFSGTIRDNLRYGRPDATDEEILAAAKAAHVDEFVESLPDGYDTEVGEVGVKLSGGQRQRVTIARAILKNPAILIFDEATSALDAKSERLVQHAIDALIGNRTVFVIAHRLSTIRHADKIVVLEGGRVSRIGTHDELMAKDGLYRELVRLQTQAD